MMPVDYQSALHPAGPQAASIAQLWWFMLAVCVVVYGLVMATLVAAVFRAHAVRQAQAERSLTRTVTTATALTTVALFGILVASVRTGRAVGPPDGPVDPLGVEVTGYQWWWDVEYQSPSPPNTVRTANELHVPVGRPVRILLAATDVIHSLWIPNLHGKMDLIPGRRTELWLQADTPGVYRGQCAEFCGLQHAHMALTVVVESPAAFEQWYAAQKQPARPSSTTQTQHGEQLVTRGPCALCHSVRGTDAGGRPGPDLTHLQSRRTLAAGTLPNARQPLEIWITDPQHVKPGVKMPPVGLSTEERAAVVAYLETLR
ncbi:MAG TPA: cytochrome c oxidase subunit II [Luteitalea sp.]|nr:cytochrome c oxidase subunit II [Luteitalea sp.]